MNVVMIVPVLFMIRVILLFVLIHFPGALSGLLNVLQRYKKFGYVACTDYKKLFS